MAAVLGQFKEQWEKVQQSNDPGHDLTMWAYPQVSAVVFAVGLVVYWLFGIVGYTPVGLLCTAFQGLVVVGVFYSVIKKQPFRLVEDPEAIVRTVFNAIAGPCGKAAGFAGQVMSCQDKILTAKVFAASLFVSCAESWVSLSTFFALIWVGAFVGTPLINKHWDQIEPHYARVTESMRPHLNKMAGRKEE